MDMIIDRDLIFQYSVLYLFVQGRISWIEYILDEIEEEDINLRKVIQI